MNELTVFWADSSVIKTSVTLKNKNKKQSLLKNWPCRKEADVQRHRAKAIYLICKAIVLTAL